MKKFKLTLSSPYLISSYVNEDGNKVILEFNETLTSTENSIGSPFTVTLDGTENGYSDTVYAPISSITSSGSKVEINLGSPINLLQQVKVTYKDKTDGNDTNVVEDLDGNDAKSFSNKNVRNLRNFISYTKDNLEDIGDPINRTNTEDSNTSVAFLKSDGSVSLWQTNAGGGDPAGNENNFSFKSSALSSGVSQIFSTHSSFAALKEDGSVVTFVADNEGELYRILPNRYWGTSADTRFLDDLGLLDSGVIDITTTMRAYAALKDDGSVVVWGQHDGDRDPGGLEDKYLISGNLSAGTEDFGGDDSSVYEELRSGVKKVYANEYSFAALKDDGSVVTWGHEDNGGNSSSVSSELSSGVNKIFSTQTAFAALKDDGSVVTWGKDYGGGNSKIIYSGSIPSIDIKEQISSGVNKIYSNYSAFAALKDDGSVVTWGSNSYGGDSSSVNSDLSSGVNKIFSTQFAFAALKDDGSVVTWGNAINGGDIYYVTDKLKSGVREIFSNYSAFAALKDDGSVVTWGNQTSGGDSSSVNSDLSSGVNKIFASSAAFAALKDDGSVVTWGNSYSGGDSSSISENLTADIVHIFPAYEAFFALKSDNTVISWGADQYQKLSDENTKLNANIIGGSDYLYNDVYKPSSPVIYGPGSSTKVLDVYGNPLTYSVYGQSHKEIDENTTSVFQFTANKEVTWSLTDGEIMSDPGGDSSKFSINQTTGELTFSSAPNYEKPIDANSDNNYIVVIRATDASNNTSEQTVAVSILDVVDDEYSISTSINSPQEGYILTTTVSTSNISGTNLYWSLSGTNISLSDFSDGALTGSGTVENDGTFSFKHSIASDGEREGYETIEIKLFSDSERTTQIGSTKSILIRDAAIEETIADIIEDVNGVKQIVSQLIEGQNYTLGHIRDYDGNLHANTGNVSDATKTSYKYQGLLDVNADGTKEAIYTNKESGRWVTASVNSETGQIDYTDYGKDGATRIVGIYIDPLVESGEVVKNSDHDSQRRFQNDLGIDNLIVKKAGDFDSDNFQEIYWKTNDGTAYLRALMHADGNIQYANYQSKSQMTEYLTANGYESNVSEIIS